MEEWDQPLDSDTSLESTLSYYLRNRLWKFVFIIICLASIFLVAGYTITIGSMNISFMETYETIWNHITDNVVNDGYDFVVWDLRLPRVIAGIIGGAGLAVCGAVMQNTMKNPLADPYTTGVSSGASLGATIALTVVGGFMASTSVTVVGAFVFS
ncbi:MAG: iron ABC transporter permease, partial [Candidatus Methanomethylophilaceae archaeon]|nr:iron ABC transporter permease [Candidatus Methanomethylophilaceae archaeon]